MEPIQLVGIVINVIVLLFIINDTKKRGMSQGWAFISILSLIGLVIYLIARKPISVNNINQPIIQNIPIIPTQNITQSIIIPDTCPHCKNPNTKKIRLCEWCENQII
jgi:hypothetical protein